jgi:hypothetical protein
MTLGIKAEMHKVIQYMREKRCTTHTTLQTTVSEYYVEYTETSMIFLGNVDVFCIQKWNRRRRAHRFMAIPQ